MNNEDRMIKLLIEALQRIDQHQAQIKQMLKKLDVHSEQLEQYNERIKRQQEETDALRAKGIM